jgi:hypothetical protein
MSTKDQALSAELHGEALLTARRPELQPLIDHLREMAQGRDDLRTEVAGVVAGSWFAGSARRGEELIAAGLFAERHTVRSWNSARSSPLLPC